jgi:8-oxo-dGTP diphosphatase
MEPDKPAPKRIGIGVVEHRRRFVIGVRQADQVLAGHAEFPGGKCRADESVEDCVVRECREETGLTVEPVERLHEIEFEYPHATVDLHFWLCRLSPVDSGDDWPQLANGFVWQLVESLADLNFPEANAPVIQSLVSRFVSQE